MSDTETEVRRLLAAATADMPPGIDLLDGFARARRRDRSRRVRGRAVLSAGVAAAGAAVTAVMLTIGSAPPALATVTTALTRTLAQNYHLTETDSFWIIARDGQTSDSAAQTCAIAADPVHHLEASTCSKGTISMREVGGYLYLNLLPGTKWDRVPAASFDRPWPPNLNGNATGATPQQMLSAIEKADKVTVAGSASGPGWTGTRYTISGRVSSTYTISGTLDVDQQGRARVLDLTTRWGPSLGVVQDLTFSDFGAQVTVTPPPADQTNITTVSHLPWPWNTNDFLF